MPSVATLVGEYSLIVVEAAAVLVALLVTALVPEFALAWRRRLALNFRRIGRNSKLSVLLTGVSVIVFRVALWPLERVPEPSVHDEFSYLLAADTYASGRLANPAHPMWVHFETFHVNQVPLYVSVYPPVQGLILAAGKVIAGTPWAGVLLSCALMAAAVCWMLQAWLPPPWPLLGGMLVAIRLCTFSYWINSYWGGAAAALGGALILGSLPRAMRQPKFAHGLILGLGIIILAGSRPYEGLAFCLPSAGVCAIWTLQKRGLDAQIWRRRILMPFVVLVAIGVWAGAYYCWRTTGSAFLMPHQVNQQMYSIARPFIWQKPNPAPTYHHNMMQTLYARYFITYVSTRTGKGFVIQSFKKAARFWLFFIGPAFCIPLIVIPFTFRGRRIRLLLWSCTAVLLAVLVEVYFMPHYAAPLTAAIYGVLLQSMRYLQVWRVRGRRAGLLLAQAIPLICVTMLVVRVLGEPLGFSFRTGWTSTWYYTAPGNLARARVLSYLRNSGDRHLVFVRYRKGHAPDAEWVYNDADIDRAPVVWARDMGASENRELVQYFEHRQIWLIEPDRAPLKLSVYSDVADLAKPANPRTSERQ